jgi:hypothetical protein
MTLLASTLSPARYICNDIRAERMFLAQFGVPLLQPVAAAAAPVVQVSSINKGTYTHNCQSTMSILVIDFTYLERKGGELAVKDLATVDSHSNRVFSYVFKNPYSWED